VQLAGLDEGFGQLQGTVAQLDISVKACTMPNLISLRQCHHAIINYCGQNDLLWTMIMGLS
jgi:hypothetical protein